MPLSIALSIGAFLTLRMIQIRHHNLPYEGKLTIDKIFYMDVPSPLDRWLVHKRKVQEEQGDLSGMIQQAQQEGQKTREQQPRTSILWGFKNYNPVLVATLCSFAV